MSFEFKHYWKLIFEKKLKTALNYRKIHMPKILYKYVSLSDNYCNKNNNYCTIFQESNERKFTTLKNNQIWMSRFDNLNDPYEYRAMYLKSEELSNKGWPLDMLDEYLHKMKSIYLIASFTTNIVDNMPMWAHYSNNHKGFCVEYRVLNPKVVYPISYEEERFAIGSIITSIFNLSNDIFSGKIDEDDKEFQFYLTLINHLGLIKHKTWQYENEYRILHADLGGNNPGAPIQSIEVGLDISGIYVGSQCSFENTDRLTKIAKDIGIKIYQMYLDDKEPNYKLSYRMI
ncbi:hypothetical protein N752_28145 [Desulforamulus aquiferis]|nr:DUF2971 domain-containing protein [Desulforamulus aquiferis]RYD01846.1 hypothetical protein N752_28145 [Desulforamulus aquiferis]